MEFLTLQELNTFSYGDWKFINGTSEQKLFVDDSYHVVDLRGFFYHPIHKHFNLTIVLNKDKKIITKNICFPSYVKHNPEAFVSASEATDHFISLFLQHPSLRLQKLCETFIIEKNSFSINNQYVEKEERTLFIDFRKEKQYHFFHLIQNQMIVGAEIQFSADIYPEKKFKHACYKEIISFLEQFGIFKIEEVDEESCTFYVKYNEDFHFYPVKKETFNDMLNELSRHIYCVPKGW